MPSNYEQYHASLTSLSIRRYGRSVDFLFRFCFFAAGETVDDGKRAQNSPRIHRGNSRQNPTTLLPGQRSVQYHLLQCSTVSFITMLDSATLNSIAGF